MPWEVVPVMVDFLKILKIPPFFISMATAAKFVLPIPIFLAYLVLLFYVSFSLLFLLWLPNEVCETYYFCSVSYYYYYYYYITPTIFG
jgi:hypothetical protein